MEEFEGYIVYNRNERKHPYGVISKDHECKAALNYFPERVKQILVQIEDKRFFKHSGIDYKAIVRASLANIRAKKIVQGGSTITQQLARNTLRINRKTVSRKIVETIKALEYESQFTKDEILKLYFENVYFGKNLRGFRSAGFYYFGKDLNQLSHAEWLYLITILRGPNFYSKNCESCRNRFNFLNKSLLESNLISLNRYHLNLRTTFNLKEQKLHILRKDVIPFITTEFDRKGKRLITTIDNSIQNFINDYIQKSKYPVSIIAFKNKDVVGFGSAYGTDYPFISRTNVGSTLKPFIYTFLKQSGVAENDIFDACSNNLDWSVREAEYRESNLTLDQALFYSNNNAFINAVSKIGIELTLNHLSEVLNRDVSEFFPSSILGATKNGITLYELGLAYSTFFSKESLSAAKKDCLSVLNKIFKEKLNLDVENAFLKTGTTNDNKERFAILKDSETTFVILRNENSITDYSKEGGFLKEIKRRFSAWFGIKTNYRWT